MHTNEHEFGNSFTKGNEENKVSVLKTSLLPSLTSVQKKILRVNWCAFVVTHSSVFLGTTEASRRLQPRAICLRARLLSVARMARDRQATRWLHRSFLNLCCPRKTNACRNTRQTNESDSRTESCAARPLSRPNPGAVPSPTPRGPRPRFGGNRCNDNRPMQMAGSSTRIVSRRKRIHQRTP
jgi:hypothetical protein